MPLNWNILKRKLDKTNYSPQAGDWAGMEQMLNQHPKFGAAKGGGFGTSGMFTVIIGAIAVSVATYLLWPVQQAEVVDETAPKVELHEVKTTEKAQQQKINTGDEGFVVKNISESKTETNTVSTVASVEQNVKADQIIKTPAKKEPQGEMKPSEALYENNEVSDEAEATEKASNKSVAAENTESSQPEASIPGASPEKESLNQFLQEKSEEDEFPVMSAKESSINETPSITADGTNKGLEDGELAPDTESVGEREQTTAIKETEKSETELNEEESKPDTLEDREEGAVPIALEKDAAEEDLNPKDFGFKWSSVGAYGINWQSNDSYKGWGYGIETSFRKGKWGLSIGASRVENILSVKDPFSYSTFKPDTNISYTPFTVYDTNVTRYWIIYGPNQGGYEYDTTITSYQDSTQHISIDTLETQISGTRNYKRLINSYNIPLTFNYYFTKGRFQLSADAGANFNFSTYEFLDGEGRVMQTKQNNIQLLLRPNVGYFITPHIEILAGGHMHIPLVGEQRRWFGLRFGAKYNF